MVAAKLAQEARRRERTCQGWPSSAEGDCAGTIHMDGCVKRALFNVLVHGYLEFFKSSKVPTPP